MTVSVSFRHLQPTDALRNHAAESVNKLTRLLNRDFAANVTLSLEKHLQVADIHIDAGGLHVRGKDRTGDMYASLDGAVAKIEKQLRRYKDKVNAANRHSAPTSTERPFTLNIVELPPLDDTAPAAAEPTPAHEPTPPRVVTSKVMHAQPLTISEAVMHMDLLDNHFIVFTNKDTRELNVLYRRDDGTYGVIEAHKT